ncbi:response regulator [Micromonospora auratinigra]|uniref:Response regulator receiver domain n=1 Tax=Micromonospora auratinigra TaxID=261654 RepID=A0A1A8Z8I7_9ACTN|nr:response regulator [Micromonospora auratinigra]SBT40176.1 Response regulator receiver domain [Micromonospora auratinigra]
MGADRLLLVHGGGEEDAQQVLLALSRSWPDVVVDGPVDAVSLVPWLRARRSTPPRLVLLDLDHDPVGATMAVTALRQDPGAPRLPVLALSGHPAPADVAAWYEAGVDGWLFRSGDFALLQTTLATGLQYWLSRPGAGPTEPGA